MLRQNPEVPMRTLSLLLALAASAPALAVPMQLTHQGRLSDSAGVPLDGSYQLQVALYADASGGAPLWSDTVSATLDQGAFSVVLGSDSGNPLESTLFDGSVRWFGLAVDAEPELPQRIAMVSVPYAVRAGEADVAAAISGEVPWSSIQGAPEDADSLADLLCDVGDVPTFDGAAWGCGSPTPTSVDVSTLNGTISIDNLPVGGGPEQVAAGDHAHAFGEITGVAALSQLPVGTSADTVAAGDHTHGFGQITGIAAFSQLPVGTTSSTVAVGDHGHDFAAITGTLDAARLSGTLDAARIPSLDASKITSGTLNAARLPSSVSGNWTAGGDLIATGGVQAGNKNATCTTALLGMIRFTGTSLEVCSASGWSTVWTSMLGRSADSPGANCKAVKDSAPTATPSGVYWVDPDGGNASNAYQAYCDQTTDGGGWQLVVWTQGSHHTGTGALAADSLPNRNTHAKLADADIRTIALAGAGEAMVVNAQATYIERYSTSEWNSFSSTGWQNAVYDAKNASGAWVADACNGHVNNRGFSTYSDRHGAACPTTFSGPATYMVTYHTSLYSGGVGTPFGVYLR
jgi:hypothetical protein